MNKKFNLDRETIIHIGIFVGILIIIWGIFFRNQSPRQIIVNVPKEGFEGGMEEDVVFQNAIQSGKPVFVKFYAPWCGHCQRAEPDWSKLMNKYNGSNKVVVVKVDGDKYKQIAQEYGVEGFPTIFLINGGKRISYEGSRDEQGYESFLSQNV